MRRLIPALLLGLPLALASLTGCGGGDSDDGGPAPAPARATGSPDAAPTAFDEYVALGDSYTAAPLVPPTDTSTTCLRSGVNYPALLTKAMPGTHLTDVSCSGASTANVTTPQRGLTGSVPPQIDAVRRTTDLVTIGLGGNDSNLFGTLLNGCTKLATSDPQGSPCATRFDAELDPTLATIGRNVVGVVARVRAKAPDARILLVGYPQIVPASGTCSDLPLATGDYPFARRVNERLDDTLERAAATSKAEYVDLWEPTEGHDICAEVPWINGRITSADRALAYHPLAVEQQHVADILVDQLRSP